MRQMFFFLLLLAIGTPSVHAEWFEYEYTCDAFPEAEAWWRRTHDPNQELERGIDNGIFWLDTRASLSISDYYKFEDPALEPRPGEVLRINWRMRTLEADTWGNASDVELGFRSSSGQRVDFALAPDYVYEQGDAPPGEPEHAYAIEPGLFHSYSFLTSDLEWYDLYVDNELAFHGSLGAGPSTPVACVFFGDVHLGRTSLSEWDFVEVTVVPEPGTGVLIALVGLLRSGRQRRLRALR